MTTVTPNLQETRRAWSEYADRVRGLEGAEYEQAEADAWDRLQSTLHSLGESSTISLDDPPVG